MLQKLYYALLGANFCIMILLIYPIPIWFISLSAIITLAILGTVLFVRHHKPKEVNTLELNRKISQHENLSGEIIFETPFNYLVQFTTFADGKWEELIPKGSDEIVAIYDVQLIPMKPTIHGF